MKLLFLILLLVSDVNLKLNSRQVVSSSNNFDKVDNKFHKVKLDVKSPLNSDNSEEFNQNLLTNAEIIEILKCFGDLNLREACVICRYIVQKIYSVLDITSMCPDVVETQFLSQRNRQWKPDSELMNKWISMYNIEKNHYDRVKGNMEKLKDYDKILLEKNIKKKIELNNLANLVQFQNKVNEDIQKHKEIAHIKDVVEQSFFNMKSPEILPNNINNFNDIKDPINNSYQSVSSNKPDENVESYFNTKNQINNSKTNALPLQNEDEISKLNKNNLQSKMNEFMSNDFKFKQTSNKNEEKSDKKDVFEDNSIWDKETINNEIPEKAQPLLYSNGNINYNFQNLIENIKLPEGQSITYMGTSVGNPFSTVNNSQNNKNDKANLKIINNNLNQNENDKVNEKNENQLVEIPVNEVNNLSNDTQEKKDNDNNLSNVENKLNTNESEQVNTNLNEFKKNSNEIIDNIYKNNNTIVQEINNKENKNQTNSSPKNTQSDEINFTEVNLQKKQNNNLKQIKTKSKFDIVQEDLRELEANTSEQKKINEALINALQDKTTYKNFDPRNPKIINPPPMENPNASLIQQNNLKLSSINQNQITENINMDEANHNMIFQDMNNKISNPPQFTSFMELKQSIKTIEDSNKELIQTILKRNKNFNIETLRRGRRRSRFPDPQWDCVETQIAKLLRYLCEEEISLSFQKYCKPLFQQISTIVESFLYHDNNIEICQNVHMCPNTSDNKDLDLGS